MGTSLNKYPDQALVGWAENAWFSFWCLVLWILLPSSCVCVPQLQTDRRELSKHTCQVGKAYSVCVSNAGLPKKENPCSWKTSKLLTFCLLRNLWRKWHCSPRCLVLLTWICWMIFLDGEKGVLGRRGPSRGDQREEVGCEVERLFGRVGRCCRSFAFFFGKETCFP